MTKDLGIPVEIKEERRAAVCAAGKTCEVAVRQQVLVEELRKHRQEFTTLKQAVEEMLAIFEDFKTILGFMKGTGVAIRWCAVTAAAATALWASITHWPKH